MKLRNRVHDWWHLERPALVCRLFGHETRTIERKFGGEILCGRCRAQIGRWSQ